METALVQLLLLVALLEELADHLARIWRNHRLHGFTAACHDQEGRGMDQTGGQRKGVDQNSVGFLSLIRVERHNG